MIISEVLNARKRKHSFVTELHSFVHVHVAVTVRKDGACVAAATTRRHAI
jgi:hypothetical protein